MKDLIIIGSGPAGLTAAIYAKRAGLDMLVLEKNPMSGGQVLNTYEVDNYPALPEIGGFDLGIKMKEHAEKLEAKFQTVEVESISIEETVKKVFTDQGEFTAKTMIIATGASHAKLQVPGEEELMGMGVSYCATCDGAFFRGKTVAVVGGGDVAIEDAIFLARTCEKVYLIHRRDELRGAKILQEKLQELPNVEILWNSTVEEIKGRDKVESLLVKNVKNSEVRELELQGVFIAVGIKPSTEIFANTVTMNSNGYIQAGEDCTTNIPGVYAAGDVREKQLRQIVTAVADGANAVTSVQNYLLTI